MASEFTPEALTSQILNEMEFPPEDASLSRSLFTLISRSLMYFSGDPEYRGQYLQIVSKTGELLYSMQFPEESEGYSGTDPYELTTTLEGVPSVNIISRMVKVIMVRRSEFAKVIIDKLTEPS